MEREIIKNDINSEYPYPENDWFHQIIEVIDALYFGEKLKYLKEKYKNKGENYDTTN